ncbi:MAG: hypothetical protein EOO39_08325 [Cytophagaceae bacterium]|nr:MAG: hypothetical protein EOO39_08325 [Cytophagaceae bacterium]
MKVYKLEENANKFSVPFDWDEEDISIQYVRKIVESYFDTNRRVGKNWQPTFFGIVEKKMKLADIGTLSGSEMVILGQKAVDALLPLINGSVELLPYPTEVGTYYLVNALDEGDYLDRKRTDCDEILPNGHCFGINEYVFKESALQGKHIFRIPDDAVTRYVSGEFIDTCKQHKLQGIYLTDSVKVWDSETA